MRELVQSRESVTHASPRSRRNPCHPRPPPPLLTSTRPPSYAPGAWTEDARDAGSSRGWAVLTPPGLLVGGDWPSGEGRPDLRPYAGEDPTNTGPFFLTTQGCSVSKPPKDPKRVPTRDGSKVSVVPIFITGSIPGPMD